MSERRDKEGKREEVEEENLKLWRGREGGRVGGGE